MSDTSIVYVVTERWTATGNYVSYSEYNGCFTTLEAAEKHKGELEANYYCREPQPVYYMPSTYVWGGRVDRGNHYLSAITVEPKMKRQLGPQTLRTLRE